MNFATKKRSELCVKRVIERQLFLNVIFQIYLFQKDDSHELKKTSFSLQTNVITAKWKECKEKIIRKEHLSSPISSQIPFFLNLPFLSRPDIFTSL